MAEELLHYMEDVNGIVTRICGGDSERCQIVREYIRTRVSYDRI